MTYVCVAYWSWRFLGHPRLFFGLHPSPRSYLPIFENRNIANSRRTSAQLTSSGNEQQSNIACLEGGEHNWWIWGSGLVIGISKQKISIATCVLRVHWQDEWPCLYLYRVGACFWAFCRYSELSRPFTTTRTCLRWQKVFPVFSGEDYPWEWFSEYSKANVTGDTQILDLSFW